MTAALLEARGLRVAFAAGDDTIEAVHGIDVRIEPGTTLGIVGESGSGKTAAARSLIGVLPAGAQTQVDSLRWCGADISPRELRRLRGRQVTMVFQDAMASLNPVLSIGRQITEVLRRKRGMSRSHARARAAELLELVRIPSAAERLKQYPHELSGGMRQRVLIAMALAPEPELLIADEPTTALDVTVQAQILELIRSIQAELRLAVILISHDLGVVASFAQRVSVMYAGRIVESGSCDDVLNAPRHPYTWGLLESSPHLDRRTHRLLAIPGAPPSITELPGGCAFHPRCAHCFAPCHEVVPPLVPTAGDQLTACHLPAAQRRRLWQEREAVALGAPSRDPSPTKEEAWPTSTQ